MAAFTLEPDDMKPVLAAAFEIMRPLFASDKLACNVPDNVLKSVDERRLLG